MYVCMLRRRTAGAASGSCRGARRARPAAPTWCAASRRYRRRLRGGRFSSGRAALGARFGRRGRSGRPAAIMQRRKVDNRIRVLIENGVAERQRALFVVVGDRGKDQVTLPGRRGLCVCVCGDFEPRP